MCWATKPSNRAATSVTALWKMPIRSRMSSGSRRGERSVQSTMLPNRIGLRVQLALEQHNEVLIVLERFGLASRGNQRLYDQAMGVLAHVVEHDGALAGFERAFGPTGGQFLFAEPDQGAKCEFKEPLP